MSKNLKVHFVYINIKKRIKDRHFRETSETINCAIANY